MYAAALSLGVVPAEADRLVSDARRAVAEAIAAGASPGSVRCMVESESVGHARFVVYVPDRVAGSALPLLPAVH